jgi:ATP-binding cassette, subfamily C, bacterial CydD
MARSDRNGGGIRLYEAGRSGIRRSVLVLCLRALALAGAAVSLGRIIDLAMSGGSFGWVLFALGALLATGAALGWAWPRLADDTRWRVESDVRLKVVGSVIDRPFASHRVGEVTNRASEGAAAVGSLAGVFLPQLIGGIVIPILICVVVAFIDVLAALILLVTVPAVPLLLRMLEKRFASVTARYWATADRLTARFFDGIQGMKTLKALDASGEYGTRLEEESEQLRRETMSLLRVNQLALLAVDSLFTLGTVVAASGAAMWRLQEGAISLGEAVALVLLGVALIEPMSQIGRFFYVGAIGRASAKDIRSSHSGPGIDFVPRTGDRGVIRLEDVSFSYEEGRRVLKDVDLAVEPGEVVALVGPSGAGKSTLAAVISGLVSPDTGRVEVEGRVAVVSQQPFLFHGSLRENLLLAAPDADDEQLWAALEAADLTGVVAGNEHGLDLQVGERGLQLSGGEAQRLTIARMLLTGAPIVVLDEPTSNVDIETEARVRAAIERLTVDKTVIVIAHRRSTIAGVDRIVAMEDGRIVADTDPASDEGTALIQAMTVSS